MNSFVPHSMNYPTLCTIESFIILKSLHDDKGHTMSTLFKRC